MNYPCAYFKDENGNMFLDSSQEHPVIHYLGSFDETKSFVKGNWEMVMFVEQFIDGDLEDISNGTFEMRRIK